MNEPRWRERCVWMTDTGGNAPCQIGDKHQNCLVVFADAVAHSARSHVVKMDERDMYMNLFVALAIMACILLPQFMFRAPTTTPEKKHG